MDSPASELARRLAQDAEAVCRHYLPNGRRQGRYWIDGDAGNTPGRSLYVRLNGPTMGLGAAGKWADAATGEHGDLLDLIAANRGLASLKDTLDEARRFLGLPQPEIMHRPRLFSTAGSSAAARRLWATPSRHYRSLIGTGSPFRRDRSRRREPGLRAFPRGATEQSPSGPATASPSSADAAAAAGPAAVQALPAPALSVAQEGRKRRGLQHTGDRNP